MGTEVACIMIEEIVPNLYRMEIPLPKSPLKRLNSYLVRSGDRFLIIDTDTTGRNAKMK